MPTDHGEVELKDVRVPADAVLGEVDHGLEVGQTFLHENRIRQAASSLGAAQYCIDRAAEYAGERVVFGKPLSVNQAVQWPLVELQTEAQMVRLLVYYAAWHLDRNHHMEVSDKVSMANYRANRLVCEAADRAMQIHGGLGYSRHEPFEHIYRHHRRYRITEGAEEIQIRRVAQRMFKFGRPGQRDARDARPCVARSSSRLSATSRSPTCACSPAGRAGPPGRSTPSTVVGSRALILRIGPPDEIHAGMELEAAALGRAAAAGAPVPARARRRRFDRRTRCNPFLICDFIGGETIVRAGSSGRSTTPPAPGCCTSARTALAAIHRADIARRHRAERRTRSSDVARTARRDG